MTLEDFGFDSYDGAELKIRRAYELYENGKLPQALLAIEDAIEINPSNAAWHFNKALALDAMGRFDDAIAEYETASQLNPEDIEIWNSLAVDYTRTGQFDRAISIFENVQSANPDFEPSYCNRIITYAEMDKHDMAEQMFYLAQQIKPDCPLCYYNIGNSLFVRGDFKKAIHCWKRAAELDPTHPQINYRVAQAYYALGDMKFAREYFLTEIRLNPGDIEVILDFGVFLLEAGDIESAKEKFGRITELCPDFAPAYFYLGEIAFNNKEYEKAVDFYSAALKKDSNMPGPRFRLGMCSKIIGRTELVKAYMMSEMELDIQDVEVLMSMAGVLMEIEELDAATNCLVKAINISEKNSQVFYYLGIIRGLKGNYKDAVELLAGSLKENCDRETIISAIAASHALTGDYKLAKLTLRDAGIKNRLFEFKLLAMSLLGRFGKIAPSRLLNRQPRIRKMSRCCNPNVNR